MKKKIIIAGFVGGAMPILVNIAKTLGATNSPGEFTGWTVLGLLIFGIIDAAAAYFFEDRAPKKAFMMGISAPALITVLATSQAGADRSTQSPVMGSLTEVAPALVDGPSPSPLPFNSASLIYSTIAQSSVSAEGVTTFSSERSLEVSSETNLRDLRMVFHDDAGSVIGEHKLSGRGFRQIFVPSSCTSFSVSSDLGESESFSISEEARSITYVSIRVEDVKTARAIQIFGLGKGISRLYRIRSEVVERSSIGTEGWIYLGDRSEVGWQTLYVRFENVSGAGLPSVGSVISPTFPLKVRSEPLSEDLISVLRVNQRVEVTEVQEASGGAVWCRMKVIE